VLIDFEEYVLVARKGGTDSKLRGEEGKTNKDEDIRQMAVQEVSFLKLFNFYSSSKKLLRSIRKKFLLSH
jgi:hypothetical protein